MTEQNAIIETIASQLQALGVKQGGVLLVHSSLRSLGKVEGGAESVVRGLSEALGPQGTLLMPALSYMFVGPNQPVFDVRNTPSCVGALPEYFRTRSKTIRSVHPTHSVSGTGQRVVEMLLDHPLDTTPCGKNSPFAKLPLVGGQVLFLGCGMRPNTSMHAIEENIVPPYLYGDVVEYKIMLPLGDEKIMKVRSHNFKGVAQRYDRLEALMTAGLCKGQVLQAECHLLDAKAMWDTALAAYQKDPLYFVEPTQ